MRNVSDMRRTGYYSHEFVGLKRTLFTANSPATGTDGVYQAGTMIDRFSIQSQFLAVRVAVPVTVAGLGGSDDVKMVIKIEDAGDTAGPFGNAVESDILTIAENGDFVVGANFDIGAFRRYLKISVKCTFAAANTDTADLSAIVIAGGLDELPDAATPSGVS